MEVKTVEAEVTEPKKFLSRGEIIEAIKDLDESIVQVSLNLIKCDFKATEEDVRRAFPAFQFVKVKNYSAGSFEVVLPLKIDAINFVKNSRDVFILSRKPIIKMGRNYVPSENEDWVFVGGTGGRGHQGGHRRHNNNREGNEGRQRQHNQHHEPRQYNRREDEPRPKHVRAEEQRQEPPSTNTKVEPKVQEPRQIETKPQEQKPRVEERKKEQTKVNNEKPPAAKIQQHADYKPFGFGRNLADGPKLTPPLKVQQPKKEELKKEEPKKEQQAKKQQQPKKEAKKPEQEQKPKAVEPTKQPEVQKPEDEGWITVTESKPRKKK